MKGPDTHKAGSDNEMVISKPILKWVKETNRGKWKFGSSPFCEEAVVRDVAKAQAQSRKAVLPQWEPPVSPGVHTSFTAGQKLAGMDVVKLRCHLHLLSAQGPAGKHGFVFRGCNQGKRMAARTFSPGVYAIQVFLGEICISLCRFCEGSGEP